MKTRRSISVLLLAALLLTASCGSKTTDDKKDTTAPSGGSDTTTTEEEEKYLDGLDFGGRKIKIFCTDYEGTTAFDNMYVEAEDGDVVNDAIYKKNQYVSDLLNVDLDFVRQDFSWDSRDMMYNALRTSVMSDEEPYNIAAVPTYFTSTFVAEGLLADLNTLPYLDMTREWWSQGFRENAQIAGKTYMAAGDAVLPFITGLFGIAFNKDLAEQNNVEDIYALVNDGKWTVDKMHDISKGIYRDLNGNGQYDEEDMYGIELLHENYLLSFLTSCDVNAITREGDEYTYTYGSERAVDAYNKVYSMIHDKASTLMKRANLEDASIRMNSPFKEGRALFTLLNLYDTVNYRDASFEYGIIPYPKLDETQQNYYTMSSNGLLSLSVPITSEGDEAVGAVLEAMAYAGSKFTTPAYFETALKIKYASDNETAQMLDLMKGSENTSIAGMFAAALGGPEDYWKITMWEDKNDGVWASTAEKNKKMFMNNLETFIEAVKETAE